MAVDVYESTDYKYHARRSLTRTQDRMGNRPRHRRPVSDLEIAVEEVRRAVPAGLFTLVGAAAAFLLIGLLKDPDFSTPLRLFVGMCGAGGAFMAINALSTLHHAAAEQVRTERLAVESSDDGPPFPFDN